MSNPLNIVEATALAKLAEKELKRLKDAGETLEPGNHLFDMVVQVDGKLGRGEDTKVTPSFSLDRYLKPLLLKYASSLGAKERASWIQALMDVNGALGAVVQLGPEAVLRSIDPNLIALWDAAEADAKTKFQRITPKTDRAGNTVVVGDLRKQINVFAGPGQSVARAVVSKKKKP
jgi:hypothetical protein